MPETKRKTKMISIRISLEEYESLKTLYEARGLRSVSELARDAMQSFANGQPHTNVETQIHLLDGRVKALEGELTNLHHLLAETLARR